MTTPSSEQPTVHLAKQDTPASPRRPRWGIWALLVIGAIVVAIAFFSQPSAPSEDAPASSSAPAESISSASEDYDEAAALPDVSPIVGEGAGYATSDSLLSAVQPGLAVALASGDGPEAEKAWATVALSFMPRAFTEAWATSAGLSSADELAGTLADSEIASLRASLGSGNVRLNVGSAASAASEEALAQRFQELGVSLTVDGAYQVMASSADDGEGGQSANSVDTGYLAFRCGDAWYFYDPSLTASS